MGSVPCTVIDRAEFGRLLTATSLSELLAAHGEQILVCGSGSSGASFLQNHKLNSAIVNVNASYPNSIRDEVTDRLGPVPDEDTPNVAQAAWAVVAYLKFGLEEMQLALSVLWLNERDHTAHRHGIGAPETIAALKAMDREIGRILEAHARRELDVNIIIISDHGFITHAGGSREIAPLLEQAGLKAATSDVVVVGGAIYINENRAEKLPRIVDLLRAQPWVGAIYTSPLEKNSHEGVVPGTFSTNVIRWNHRRAADIYVETDWNDTENEFGIKGTNFLSGEAAGHGSASPYELHASLLAVGPAFKQGCKNTLPTGNVDIAPTIAHLLGHQLPASMQGRILTEILRDGPPTDSITVEEKVITVSSESVTTTAHFDVLGKHTYLNYVKAQRSKDTK